METWQCTPREIKKPKCEYKSMTSVLLNVFLGTVDPDSPPTAVCKQFTPGVGRDWKESEASAPMQAPAFLLLEVLRFKGLENLGLRAWAA